MEELDKQNIQKEPQDVIDEINSSKDEDVKNTDNIKPNKKPKLTKKFYILTGVFGAVFAGIGTLSGVMIGQEVFAVSTDYSSIDLDNLEDDNEALIKKYQSTSKDKYVSTFEPYELVNIGLYNVTQHKSIHIITSGDAIAVGVEQKIRGNFVRDNDEYFSESISSSSLVKVAWRFYEDSSKVDVYSGTVKSAEVANWNEKSKEEFTLERFEETWGRTFERPNIYVISSKTILNDSLTTDSNGNYVVSLDLHTTYSVVRYVKQMQETSGLSKPPTFKSVHLDFTLTPDLEVLEKHVKESYEVMMFGKHQTDAEIVDKYNYDNNWSIPSLSEKADYEQ